VLQKVNQDTYLGDILSSDGRNKININDRVCKGRGIMNKILNILETVSFGYHYFRIFVFLRESMFVNGTLTNADVWYGFEPRDLKELENLDREMIRKVFQCPFSTPVEAGHLELGLLPLSCIVKERRVHYILKSEKSQMLYKFFIAQWENPTKHDWTETVKSDLRDLGIRNDFSYLESKTQISFKNLVNARIKEFALDMLNEIKYEHSKMDNLLFTELKIQEYLAENISVKQKRNIFHFRTRMATFSENYRGQEPQKPCQICVLHVDSQEHSVNCLKTMQNVCKKGKYCEIFSRNISSDTAIMLEQIMKNRQNKLG
jgi:hypothetical protein